MMSGMGDQESSTGSQVQSDRMAVAEQMVQAQVLRDQERAKIIKYVLAGIGVLLLIKVINK